MTMISRILGFALGVIGGYAGYHRIAVAGRAYALNPVSI
jgi:hypothetical protein